MKKPKRILKIIICVCIFLIPYFYITIHHNNSKKILTTIEPLTVTNQPKEIFAGLNQARKDYDLDMLTANKKLGAAAYIKAQELADCGCFQHVLPSGQTAWDLINATGYDYLQAGEILADGYSNSDDVITAWMNSPGHRSNILNPNFKEMGVGIVIADNNKLIIAVEFGDPVTTSTPEFIKLK